MPKVPSCRKANFVPGENTRNIAERDQGEFIQHTRRKLTVDNEHVMKTAMQENKYYLGNLGSFVH